MREVIHQPPTSPAAELNRYIAMKTIKIAIYINVLLYAINLAYAAWGLSTVISAPKFSYEPNLDKFFFISFSVVFYGLFGIAMFGLILRKNWGRILALVMNLFLSTGIIAASILDEIGIRELSFTNAIMSKMVIISYIRVSPFICLAVVLFNARTKEYFRS